MAIRILNTVVVDNTYQLKAVNGYDSTLPTRMIAAVQTENNTFTVYNSSGTAIKTVSFVTAP